MTEENENAEFICPITLEIFRDPVKAGDGHIYEREAIQRWILEHGTSPITRQTLQINDLVRDEQLRKMCQRKRQLSVSYNPQEDRVILPPLQNFVRNNHQVNPEITNIIQTNFNMDNISNKRLILIILFSFIFPSSLIIGIVQGLKNSYTDEIDITSTYSDTLTTNNSYINQTGISYPGIYYYETIQVNISVDGFYGFEIQSQSAISIDGDLYVNYFNSTDLSSNLISYTYKDKNYSNTYFGNFLSSNKYVLMITTYFCCSQGSFSLLVTGPANVYFY
ncbi:unnamed protein product [Adineta steineri]|uniref:U-box domain-containing protein n=1 Tax=Adineta steineri TaxID=433720 RepID=A0A814T3J0_9BILA|nr:unnamed protein product [Adineta steineri]CAF3784631.1 unnamed protein product [Adineta steineri]